MSKTWTAGEPLLNSEQMDHLLKKTYTSPIIYNTMGLGTTTGNDLTKYDREYEVEKVAKQHSKKYFYVISVSDTEDVHYQVYHGGKIAFWVFKLLIENPHYWKSTIAGSNTSWKSIRKRTHLPATVGATYLEIDKDIEAHKQTLEHDAYAKGILEAEPDGLKMIEGLEKLQEGEPEDEDPLSPWQSYNSSASDSFYMTST